MSEELNQSELSQRNNQRLRDLEAPGDIMDLLQWASPETASTYIDSYEAEWTAQRDSLRAMGLSRAEAGIAQGFGVSLEEYAAIKAKRNGG